MNCEDFVIIALVPVFPMARGPDFLARSADPPTTHISQWQSLLRLLLFGLEMVTLKMQDQKMEDQKNIKGWKMQDCKWRTKCQ